MLGLEFESGEADGTRMLSMVACIAISGDYRAVVEVAMTPKAANEVTTAMCGLEPGEVQESDVADSIGEIVNIIGGNIKGAIPGETKLSLPCVSLNADESQENSSPEKRQVFFRLAGEPFAVTLIPG